MKDYPTIPPFSAAPPDLLSQGHLWLYEDVLGVVHRFRLTENGTLHVGDRHRTYDPNEIPLSHRHAVRHVRDRLNRDALRAAVDDVEHIVFFGCATIQQGIPYEWERLPSFLGLAIWHGDREQLLPPDTVETIYRRLGLEPLTTVAKEVHVRDFDATAYEFPQSAWYDGPVAGIIIRNKQGGIARCENPGVTDVESDEDLPVSPTALAQQLATDRRLSRVVDELETRGRPITFDAVQDRLFETIIREEYQRVFEARHDIDSAAVRSALGPIVGTYLAD